MEHEQSHATFLAEDGVVLIGELARIGEAELVAPYGKISRQLFLFSQDEDDCPVDPDREAKSVPPETTLDEDAADLKRLRPILWRLTLSTRGHTRTPKGYPGVSVDGFTASPIDRTAFLRDTDRQRRFLRRKR